MKTETHLKMETYAKHEKWAKQLNFRVNYTDTEGIYSVKPFGNFDSAVNFAAAQSEITEWADLYVGEVVKMTFSNGVLVWEDSI